MTLDVSIILGILTDVIVFCTKIRYRSKLTACFAISVEKYFSSLANTYLKARKRAVSEIEERSRHTGRSCILSHELKQHVSSTNIKPTKTECVLQSAVVITRLVIARVRI